MGTAFPLLAGGPRLYHVPRGRHSDQPGHHGKELARQFAHRPLRQSLVRLGLRACALGVSSFVAAEALDLFAIRLSGRGLASLKKVAPGALMEPTVSS